ncbi:MAG: TPM domain-containing protein, partial [Candidatus Tumulicola sp.]
MNRPLAVAALALTLMPALPAAARDFVVDQAGMFSSGTVSALNARIGSFNAQTGKEIVVMTVPSLGTATLPDAAAAAFAQQKVNGVLIYIARDDRKDIIVPDRAGSQAGWFTPDVVRSIRTSMESQFRTQDYDAGIAAAVDGILSVYRAHLNGLRQKGAAPASAPAPASSTFSTGGFHISMLWWIVIVVVGFLILRSVMRTMSAPRYGAPGMPPGATPPAGTPGPAPYGGMPFGGYGGGGGGSFWSGLLGGLGGAWLGNEMFGGRGGGAIGPA